MRCRMMPSLIGVLAIVAGASTVGAAPAELILLDGAGAGSFAAAQDVTPDGQMVVGTSDGRVFRWTAADGMVGLGQPAGASSRASAISSDGSVIGGFFEHETWGVVYPAIYCPGGERMRDLGVVLTEAGVTIPADVLLLSATAITPDGTTVVGQALNGTTFNYVPFVARFFIGPCPMFADGFEGGDTAAWSATVP